MAMCVNQTGQQCCAASVQPEIELLGQLFLFGEEFSDLAVAADKHRVKTDDLAVFIERDAVDVFD